jgi:lipoprotein NlpD
MPWANKNHAKYFLYLIGVWMMPFQGSALSHAEHLAPVITLTPYAQSSFQSAPSKVPLVLAQPVLDAPSGILLVRGQRTYTVKKGDTLYSIAFVAGLDYEDLAAFNHISAPYTLSIGQVLELSSDKASVHEQAPSTSDTQTIYWTPKKKDAGIQVLTPALSSVPKPPVLKEKNHLRENFPAQASWQWPVKGRVLAGFSKDDAGNHGVNIAGQEGMPIQAAASGLVVYSDNGIQGYGNMIIVKNTTHFLSAYAYNAKNLVQDGQWVEQGQEIATMGRNLSGTPMLHFEIRLHGKAVDPMRYLPS